MSNGDRDWRERHKTRLLQFRELSAQNESFLSKLVTKEYSMEGVIMRQLKYVNI